MRGGVNESGVKEERESGKTEAKGRCSAWGRERNVGMGGWYNGGCEENMSQTERERERERERKMERQASPFYVLTCEGVTWPLPASRVLPEGICERDTPSQVFIRLACHPAAGGRGVAAAGPNEAHSTIFKGLKMLSCLPILCRARLKERWW